MITLWPRTGRFLVELFIRKIAFWKKEDHVSARTMAKPETLPVQKSASGSRSLFGIAKAHPGHVRHILSKRVTIAPGLGPWNRH